MQFNLLASRNYLAAYDSSQYDVDAPPRVESVRGAGGTSDSLRGGDAGVNFHNADGGDERRTSSFRRAPRSVAIQYAREGGIISARSLDYDNESEGTPASFEEDSMPAKGPRVRPSWFEPNAADFVDGVDDEVCVPMYDWQLASYPSCNRFHELDMRALRVINTGGSRIAFELRENLPNNARGRYVYKTVKYRKEVTARLVEEQRKDAIVLERTSSSNFIPDIHGYCSLGVMMDFMPEGNMHDYIKGARLAGGSTLGPVDRLRLSM